VTNEEDAPQMDANRRLADAILATAVDPIIVIDRDGLIQEANTATTTLFGHERSAMVGRNVSMLMGEANHRCGS
jgi:PAS domain S-box-containing protein